MCVTPADSFALVPRGPLWRLNARANARRYGAPVAVPLLTEGLDAWELLDAVRHYSGSAEGPVRQPVGEACFFMESLPVAGYRRFRRRLLAWVIIPTTFLGVLFWSLFGVGVALSSSGTVLQTLLLAVGATFILAGLAIGIYSAVLPPYGRLARRARS